jgi:hypothetical protein
MTVPGDIDPPGNPPSVPGDVTDNQRKAAAEMADDMRVGVERTQRLLEIEKERLKAIEDHLQIGQKTLQIQEKMIAKAEAMVIKMSEITIGSEEWKEALNKVENSFKDIATGAGAGKEALEKFNAIIAKLGETNDPEEARKALERLRAEIQDVGDVSDDIGSNLSSLAGKFGMTAKAGDSASGKMLLFGKSLTDGLSGDKMAQLSNAANGMLSLTNIAANLVDVIGQAALQLDSVGSAFGKATGFGRGFEEQIMDVYAGTALAGVSMEEAGQAMQTLATEFSGFDKAATQTNIKLAQNIALLEKVGVSGSQSAKIMDSLSRSFNLSATRAADLTRELITSGQAAGITASKMAADFQSSFGTLAQYGSQATQVFKGMAAQAKATGMEMGQLISMAQKFDTFEGATSAAASLNAVLGTQLSSIELLNADYEERINLLRTGIQTTVGSFDSMDRFTQMYVAQAIGAKDVAEAQRLINMSTAEYAGYKDDMAAGAKTQEQLAEVAERLVPIMDRFKLAIAGVLLQFSGLITFVSWAMEGMTQLEVMLPLLAVGIFAVGIAMQASFGKWMLLITMMGGVISLLGTRINPLFIVAFGFMAQQIIALGLAAQLGGYKLILLVASLGLVFGAIALVIYAISEVIQSITGLFALMIDSATVLPQTAMGIYLVAGAVGALGLATMLSLGSVLLLMSALTGIGAVIAGVGMVTGISALGEVASHIASVGDGLNKFAQSMISIKSAVAEIKALGGGGFIAATVEGNKTSMVVASSEVINSVKPGDIKVSVDMPDIKVPAPVIHVYIDGQRQTDAIVKVVSDRLAGV